MKKNLVAKILVALVATTAVFGLVGCGVTTTETYTESYTDENGETITTTTTTVTDENGETTTETTVEESNINSPVLAASEQYDSIISQLQPGQAYGFADICTEFDVLLVSEDGAYDYGDGTMGAINVKVYGLDADGNVIEYGEANSGGTAYPMAVYDGCLMICNNARTMMEYIDGESLSMITRKCVEVSYDEDGNASYSFMDADTQTDGVTDDDSMMQEMYDMFSNAVVINFTVVE